MCYEDGTAIPTFEDFTILKNDLAGFEQQLAQHQEQLNDIRNAYQKSIENSTKFYNESQEWKNQFTVLGKEFEKWKANNIA